MPRTSIVAAAAGYLLVCAAALLGFIAHATGGLPQAWVIALCSSPVVLLIATTAREPSLQQFSAKTLACMMFPPALLLMWVCSAFEPADGAAASVVSHGDSAEALPQLDLGRLFAGALAVQDVPLGAQDIAVMRAAAFSDGTELRLQRFTTSSAASAHLTLALQSQSGTPLSAAGRHGFRLAAAPDAFVYLEAHGVDLVQMTASDQARAFSRLDAQGVPLPPAGAADAAPSAVPAATAEATVRVWPFAVGAALTHALALVLFVLWAGRRVTRVPASRAAPPVPADVLRARLLSLAHVPGPFEVGAGDQAGEILLRHTAPGEARTRTLRLIIDADTHEVRARERITAEGARPATAEERDMRPVGSVGIDPKRPNAQRVWTASAVTSILEPEALALVPAKLVDDHVELPPEYARALDADTLALLLCSIVTRSGFTWQPVFFARD